MAYLVIISILWGFSFVIIKAWLTPLDSNFVSFARLFLSFLVFAPLIRVKGIRLKYGLQLAVIGSIQFGFMYVAYIAAYQYLAAHTLVLLTTTTPLFVTLINSIYERRLHKAFLLAASLAVAGGAVIRYPNQALSASLIGIVLVQLSNAAFAFGQIAYKRLVASNPGLRDKNVFGLMYAGAVLVAAVFSSVTTDFHQLALEPVQWAALFYLGVVASGVGFFLWNVGACKVNEGALAVMNNLKIPIGVFLSLVLLGETADYGRLLIGSLLLASALLINRRFR